jgi:glycerol-3-phosphate O-acyltransferase
MSMGNIGTRAGHRDADSGIETVGVERVVVMMVLAIAGSMAMVGSAPVSAEEIYKSVDHSGKVTYSTVPPADAVSTKTLPPPHQPTRQEVCAAEAQYQLIKTFGAELEQDRKQREAQQALQAAELLAQQNASELTIVFLPVPVIVGPIHPVSNHRGHFRLKRESMGLGERPRLL